MYPQQFLLKSDSLILHRNTFAYKVIQEHILCYKTKDKLKRYSSPHHSNEIWARYQDAAKGNAVVYKLSNIFDNLVT